MLTFRDLTVSGFNRFSAGPCCLSLSPCLCLSVSLSISSPPLSLCSLCILSLLFSPFYFSLSSLCILSLSVYVSVCLSLSLSLSLLSVCLSLSVADSVTLSLPCLCLSVSVCLSRLSRIPPLSYSSPLGKNPFTLSVFLSVSLSLSAFPPVHPSLCLAEQLRQTQSKTILSIRRVKLSVQCTFYDCRNSFA